MEGKRELTLQGMIPKKRDRAAKQVIKTNFQNKLTEYRYIPLPLNASIVSTSAFA
jgi:uncharacterized membrane protein YheB (UPF0754 family)